MIMLQLRAISHRLYGLCRSLNKVLTYHNVANSKPNQRLQCVTASISPPNDPSKNWPAADRPTAALGHTGVETRISVKINAAHVALPHTTCIWTIFVSAGDVVPPAPPSLVVPRLWTTDDA